MRKVLLGLVSRIATLVAVLAVQPTSWLAWYQPEIPKELRK
ncbi:MAG: cyclic lactone autoinducer peptide [Candidatus Methanomethyliaceae archaeon]